jgi:hypothetical protein
MVTGVVLASATEPVEALAVEADVVTLSAEVVAAPCEKEL